MPRRRTGFPLLTILLLLALFLALRGALAADPEVPALPPAQPAVEAILEAFETHAMVGLGELHGNEDVHDVLRALVRDRRLADVTRDLVVEFGNARYQDVVDQYVAGEDLPIERVRPAWRDTVNPLTWDCPMYERFFRTVREVNATREPDRRLRVLLGDVPVDWSKVTKMADLGEYGSRDVCFADIVDREVLAKGRKALLVAGQWHLYRRNPSMENPAEAPLEEQNTAELLLKRHPGQLWVVQPADFGKGAAEFEPRLAELARGSVVPVRGGERDGLGALDFGRVTPFTDKQRVVDGKTIDLDKDAPFIWPRVNEVTDAYLWLGPKRELRWTRPIPSLYLDDPYYLAEIRRRGKLMAYPAAHFKLMTGQEL